MKFGCRYHEFQVPELGPAYVQYGRLKLLYKKTVISAYSSNSKPNFAELYALLESNRAAFKAFCAARSTFLDQRRIDIAKRHGVHLSGMIYQSPFWEIRDQLQLDDASRALYQVQQDLAKLRWYCRVNDDAMNKIYAKIQRLTNRTDSDDMFQLRKKLDWKFTSDHCESRCKALAEKLDENIDQVYEARDSMNMSSSHRSLYLIDIYRKVPLTMDYLDKVCTALRDDDAVFFAALSCGIPRKAQEPTVQFASLVRGLVQASISCGAIECAKLLLSHTETGQSMLDESCICHLISVIGQKYSCAAEDWIEVFRYSLKQTSLLQKPDRLGRCALHYCAMYGAVEFCKVVMDSLKDDEASPTSLRDGVLLEDGDGRTALHYAVFGNRWEVVSLFLEGLDQHHQPVNEPSATHLEDMLGELLEFAIRQRLDKIVELLITRGAHLSSQEDGTETALYVASRAGHADYVQMLLAADIDRTCIEVSEPAHGWTPLFIAAVGGHLSIVKLLLDAGADQRKEDHLGWTVQEHAAFKGRYAVARIFDLRTWEGMAPRPLMLPQQGKAMTPVAPILESGTSQLIVNFGTTQNGRPILGRDLSYNSSSKRLAFPDKNNDLSLEVSVIGSSSSSHLLHLPLLEDLVNWPMSFSIDGGIEPKVLLRVYRRALSRWETFEMVQRGALVGSGVALLDHNRHRFGENRESMIREHSVPILKLDSMELWVDVMLTYVIAKPYQGNYSPSTARPVEVKETMELAGHRGLGQNTSKRHYLQLGENTLESFHAAARLGASFVESDVQITRDLVPILYHDFSLSESGTDVAVHDITLAQFKFAGKSQSSGGKPIVAEDSPISKRVFNANVEQLKTRMEHTVDFAKNGFKPNTAGDFVHGSLITLEEFLVNTPDSLGFCAEIKYPRLHEAIDAGVAPVTIEINTFVDKALEKIFQFGGARNIILSSFTPEICILLALKQKTYPVVFISNAGKLPITDKEKRAESLQTAVRFAKRWSLDGIVIHSEPLLLCPRMIRYVRDAGLSCASYGPLNDDPANVKIQEDSGLSMLMTDKVGLISKHMNNRSQGKG